MLQQLERNPQYADRITSESHGDHHLSCSYKILLNTKTYRFEEEFPNTLLQLKTGYCGSAKAKAQVQKNIRNSTDRCKNPSAQPAWGHPLDPL